MSAEHGVAAARHLLQEREHVLEPSPFGQRVGRFDRESSFICERLDTVLPAWFTQGLGVTFYFGGTSLLIVVGVAMDTVQQVESQLIMRHYDGFMKKTRIRGRRG